MTTSRTYFSLRGTEGNPGNLTGVVTLLGHTVEMTGGTEYRTALMLLADDAMDMIGLIYEGHADAAEVAAEMQQMANDVGIAVTIDGKPLSATNLPPAGDEVTS